MNRREWKTISRQGKNCSKELWSAYWRCRRYWQPIIEEMKKTRPNMGIIIHHKLCKYNDEHYEEWSINHTIPMYRDEHTKYHSNNSAWNKNRIEKIQKAMSAPEMREKLSVSAKRSHAQPAYRERQKNSHLALMKNQEFKENHRKATKLAMNKPKTIEKVKLARLRSASNPETIRKIRHSLKITNALPETKKRRSDAMNQAETKAKQSMSIKTARLKEFGITAFGIRDTMLGWSKHINIQFGAIRYNLKIKKISLESLLISRGFNKEICLEAYKIT
jgi:hypothetical protein